MAKRKAKSPKNSKKVVKKSKQESESPPDLDAFLEDWKQDNESDAQEEEEESSSDEVESKSTKDYVSSLKNKDPEFYKFLKENDGELLNFDDDDSEEEDSDKDEKVHKPPSSLEVASDESDFEMEDEIEDGKKAKSVGGRQKITKKLISQMENELSSENPSISSVNKVSEALKAAIGSLASSSTEKKSKTLKKKGKKGGIETSEDMFVGSSRYVVEGGAAFNSVVRLCLSKMEPALKKVLKMENADLKPQKLTKSKKWKPLNKTLKSYTLDLVRLLRSVTEESVIGVVLKHCHQLLPFYACLPKSSKHLLQELINFWSTADESVRILAFMCIIRLTRLSQQTLLETVMKQLYMAYVKNCRFTSPNTWPTINFMRRSLAEIFLLDEKVAYNHAFMYIRQLGISLRNAVTSKKKESIQAVYNWQFVHSSHLWAHILGSSSESGALSSLIFPLVQVIDGAIRLIYNSKFYPLRFHLAKILTKLSSETDTFIPVLPYFMDVLRTYPFNKKTAKMSVRPVDFTCILRISKSQFLENGTKDAIMDQIYSGVLEYLSTQSCKIGFPELVIPCIMQLREFNRTCKVANFCKKSKQLLEKIEENRKFIIHQRKSVNFSVGDHEKISEWEKKIKAKGSPLSKFFENWNKVKIQEAQKAKRDEISGDYEFIPKPASLKKEGTGKKKHVEEDESFEGLFDNDEEDSDDNWRFEGDDVKKEEMHDNEEEESDEMDEEDDIDDEEESQEEESDEEDEENGDDEGDIVKDMNGFSSDEDDD